MDEKSIAVQKICRTGLRHQQMGIPCQDAVASSCTVKVSAIALADGAGSAKNATEGARITTDTMIRLLTKHFSKWIEMDKKEAQLELLIQLKEPLYQYCRETRCSISDLSSTAIGAAVCEDKFLIIHLGDGYVFQQKKGKWGILSFPENGIRKSQTVLTSSYPAASHLRIYSGSMEQISRICLCSDGWGSGLEQIDCIQKALYGAEPEEYTDDISAIQLYVTGEEAFSI